MRNHLDLALTHLTDLDDIAQVPHAVVDFDFLVKEFFKGGDVEDFVGGGLGRVDYELFWGERESVSVLVFGRLGGQSGRGEKRGER